MRSSRGLSEVPAQLAIEKKRCRELSEEILKLKSGNPDKGRDWYRNLLQVANSAIVLWRSDGTILFFNEYAQKFFGYTEEEIIGKPVRILISQQETSSADLLQDILQNPLHYVNNINQNVCKDGRCVWMTWTNRAILDREGRVSEILAVGNDITERRNAEKALQQLNETLEQQVAERTQIAEARTRQLQVLTVDLIEAEEKERRRIAELLHNDLQQVLAAARLHLQSIDISRPPGPELATVDRLLTEAITRARRLSHDLSLAVLHQAGFVAALKWLVAQMAEQFAFRVELEENDARQFEASPLKVFMFRVVQELLFNAVKHASVDKARVELSVSDCFLILNVYDSGKGFDAWELDTHKIPKGFGLLSIRERAGYIGGKFVVKSLRGQGCHFTLKVPIHLPESGSLLRRETDRQTVNRFETYDSPGMERTRIILADDHRVMRKGLLRLINSQPNLQVVGEAENGREAIELVRQLKPDVVVMDVSMPEMDGIEATRHISAEWPEVRVVGLSMHEDEQINEFMYEVGAASVISKAASLPDLLRAIFGADYCGRDIPVSKKAQDAGNNTVS